MQSNAAEQCAARESKVQDDAIDIGKPLLPGPPGSRRNGPYRGASTMTICRPSMDGSSSTLATVAVSAFTRVIRR